MREMKTQFGLIFKKKLDPFGNIYDSVESLKDNPKYQFLSCLLPMLDVEDCKEMIESIENSQKGIPYDSFHGPDSLSDGDQIDIIPPNVVFGSGDFKIPMDQWKPLMQNWIEFKNQKYGFSLKRFVRTILSVFRFL